MNTEQLERKICAAICKGDEIKAREIACRLSRDQNTLYSILNNSLLHKDLCYQDDTYQWHGTIRQIAPHG